MSDQGFTIDDLQNQIKYSTIPSNGDGICNSYRTQYICEVFDAQDIDLNTAIPYECIMDCKSEEKVTASIHLAKLQFQFNESCRALSLIEDNAADYFNAYLHSMIRQMTHHLYYVARDKPTPPLSFN